MLTRVPRLLSTLFWTLFWMAALAAPAWALQPPQPQNEFVPVDQLPPGEQLPSAPLLVAAYAFVWIAVMFYVWTIWRRLNKVEADMRALEQRRAADARR
jgi:CcmD family protein